MAQDFRGRGWAFPLGVSAGGGIALADGDEDIKQAIRILLGTALGERAMRPDFGSPVHDLVFDPTDPGLIGKARFYVANALEHWEPRITIERVDARVEGPQLLIEVQYLVRQTNRRDNLVFPYYLQGGE
jgi:phage baseplate assembly protein W